jgi:hypothetical protein
VALVVAWLASTAYANPPALGDYHRDGLVVRVPAHWVVTVDAKQGTAIARQDPKRKDAPALFVTAQRVAAGATEDALLDAIAARVATAGKQIERGPLSGGHGHGLIEDGTSDGVAVRIAAVAVIADGVAYVGVLAATRGDFDALGGAQLVLAALQGIHAETSAGIEAIERESPRGDQPDLDPDRPAVAKAKLARAWEHTYGDQMFSESHRVGNVAYGQNIGEFKSDRYELHSDGSYKLTRLDKIQTQTCPTTAWLTETGRYTTDGRELVVAPKTGSGRYSLCGGKTRTDTFKVTPARRYQIELLGDGWLTFVGPSCTSFVETPCVDHARFDLKPYN